MTVFSVFQAADFIFLDREKQRFCEVCADRFFEVKLIFVEFCEYRYYTVGKVGILCVVKRQMLKNRGFVNLSTEFLTFLTSNLSRFQRFQQRFQHSC